MMTKRLPSFLTFFAFVACGGATALGPDDGSGGASGSGGTSGTGAVTGASGKATGAVTGAGGKSTGGVTGAGGKSTGGVTGAGGKGTSGNPGAGGGGTATRWAKEYDQSCRFDGDCVPVSEGPVCGCSACFNAAINRNEYARWANTAAPCMPLPCDPIGCVEMTPVCLGGTCGVRAVDYIAPGQFDRTCTGQSDCHLIPVGDLCAGCNCEFDAVSEKGLEQYKARVANGPPCGSPGVACDCAVPQAVCRLDGSRTQCAAVY